MIDRLHTLIGNTARYAAPKEAKELLAVASKGEGLVHAINDMKQLCNQYLGNMVMTEDRQKEFDELLMAREELFTAVSKNKQKFIGQVQRIKWREENKKRAWKTRIRLGVKKEGAK